MVSEIGTIRVVRVEDEVKSSYLDYAMSVIVSRALPDVRDGLKPVHRRILYAMEEMGQRHNTPYRKSARVVGEVLGKFHPHGDAPVYEALVRMAQDFSMRHPLIDGQGNFGSVDNDPPAAMRYTEVRMAAIADEMLADIDKDTVNFTPNFDDSLKEPTVLPSRLPNLLVNGASGIAVGMATNIPPHNLVEIVDAVILLIKEPDTTAEDLAEIVRGPDFPTAAFILGHEGIKNAYTFGQGRVVLQARTQIEETAKNRQHIIVRELPYQVNKAALLEKIADLVKAKKIEGISDLRDESDRQGMRMVIELKKDAHPRKVLNALYKFTTMRTAFYVNTVALVNGEPRVLTLKMALLHFLSFRREIVTRRARFDLARAKERAHILEGLRIALDNLDAVIETIRNSQSAEAAKTNLKAKFQLSDLQAQAILDLQLRRLAALERKKILDEYAEIIKTIAYLEDLLANPGKIDFVIREELDALKKKHGEPRRTQILDVEAQDFNEEDLIQPQEVAVTLSSRGYVKRVSCDTYRPQRRGGRGVTGMATRETDDVRHLLVADTLDSVLFFTNRGWVFQVKAHEIPEATRQAKGLPIVNLVSCQPNERVTAVVAVSSFGGGRFMVLATARGEVKKTALEGFSTTRAIGLVAMDLEEGDELVAARLVGPKDDVILVTQDGQAMRFGVEKLRPASRSSGGVRGIKLDKGDQLVTMCLVEPNGFLLTVTENGYGKLTAVTEYPRHGRGGSGVITFRLTEKTGKIATARMVQLDQDLLFLSTEGIVLRTPASGISQQGRITQGVTLMNIGIQLKKKERVVAVSALTGCQA
ncbi:MAG: DNA gyrase subunit A [Dehalococcoidia bacterium]|nr:DNA gyrase subunit A [Dehalococcoidia bacterium]